MPPSSRITANARLLTVSDRIIAEDDAAGAVDAGQHADRRKITVIGIPSREENELSRMLAPTSTAPMTNKLLMVLASKISFS